MCVKRGGRECVCEERERECVCEERGEGSV